MKRFYTVKEAAEILGFSTNTIYKYLDEGKLKSKRIGKGRFKIPHEQLEPFLSTTEKAEEVIAESIRGDKISSAIRETADHIDKVPQETRDFIFFRILLSFWMVGRGLIYIFGTKVYFLGVLFLIAGGLFFLSSLYIDKISKFRLSLIQFYTLFVFVCTIIFSVYFKEYEGLVVPLAAFIIILFHQLRGSSLLMADIFKEYLLFSMIFMTILGILILTVSNQMSLTGLAFISTNYPFIFGMIYFGLFSALPLYLFLLPPEKRKDSWIIFYLFVFSIVGIVMATALSVEAAWASSFSAYLFSIFGFFLVWWKKKADEIDWKEFHYLILGLTGIALGIALALLGLRTIQENYKASSLVRASDNLSEIVVDMEETFSSDQHVVVTEITELNLKGVILGGGEEQSISSARVIYGKIPNLRRVAILDRNGNVLGAYPRDSVVQGASFSSRDFFEIVKVTSKPYISGVYEAVTNVPIAVEAIPVFEGNDIVGMVMLGFDLNGLSENYQNPKAGGEVYAFDAEENYVLAANPEKIGTKVDGTIVEEKEQQKVINGKYIRAYDYVQTARWDIYIERQVRPLNYELLNINLLVTLVIVINAAFALNTAMVVAKKWKEKS